MNDNPKHPIEFSFDVNESSISSAQLLLLCHDVDQYTEPGNPEIDKVFVNNTYVGDLTGANDEDSTTIFTIPSNAISAGRNRVRINVNQNPGAPPDEWCVEIKQAQLIINGGCTGQASCRSVETNGTYYEPGATVSVSYEIDTTATSQQIRVESNLVNPDGVIVAGAERNYTTGGSANDSKFVDLVLPSIAADGVSKAQVLVFDAASGQLESSCEATFTVTGGGGGCTMTCNATVPATAQVGQTVNLTGTTNASLTVRLYNGNGNFLGSYSVTLAPGQWKQTNQPYRNMPGYVWLDAGSAKITVTSGSGIVVYGSVIDKITNDPTTIPFYQ